MDNAGYSIATSRRKCRSTCRMVEVRIFQSNNNVSTSHVIDKKMMAYRITKFKDKRNKQEGERITPLSPPLDKDRWSKRYFSKTKLVKDDKTNLHKRLIRKHNVYKRVYQERLIKQWLNPCSNASFLEEIFNSIQIL